MEQPPTARQRALYRREYPRLIRQLTTLARLAAERDPNIAFIALFGSTARWEPHQDSDADVLILATDPAAFDAAASDASDADTDADADVASDASGVHLLWMAYQGDLRGKWDDLGRWPATAFVSDLLGNVARDGVEVYRRPGFAPPARLARLERLGDWAARVTTWLESR
jgi:predicted nucleotidyltransferase